MYNAPACNTEIKLDALYKIQAENYNNDDYNQFQWQEADRQDGL